MSHRVRRSLSIVCLVGLLLPARAWAAQAPAIVLTGSADPGVETSQPVAFVLTKESAYFRRALKALVVPQRCRLAAAMLADQEAMAALRRWPRLSVKDRLALFARVADRAKTAMDAPEVVILASDVGADSAIAKFGLAPGRAGGVIRFDRKWLAQADRWAALALVVHELRHACQYRLDQDERAGKLPLDDAHTDLLVGYRLGYAAWNGGGAMSWGDYVHLDQEYDAFQTGNYVAAVVSHGAFDPAGFGYLDTHYDAQGRVDLDLDSLERVAGDVPMISLTNALEIEEEKAHPVVRRIE